MSEDNKCTTAHVYIRCEEDSRGNLPNPSMELADGAGDIVHPEVRAHISSLVSAVSQRDLFDKFSTREKLTLGILSSSVA